MCKGTLKAAPTSISSSSSSVGDGKIPPSGFEKRRSLIEIGLLLFSAIYGGIYYSNPDIDVNPEFCSQEILDATNGACRRPDLIAYKVVALSAMITMGLIGVYNWHFTSKMKFLGSRDASPEDRLFGALDASDYLNVVIFCYQLWDFVISFTIPEHFDAIFLVHHFLAMLTALFSLEYQMVSYYSIFYGGCSEFSSIFLVFVDEKPLIEIVPGSPFDLWIQACQVLFFFTFSYYRIYGWISYSFNLWSDCNEVISSGSVEKYRPGKSLFLRVFQGMDFSLGALQCFWYYKILEMVASIVAS